MEFIKLEVAYYNELIDAVAQCKKLTNKNASLRGLILEQTKFLRNVYEILSVKCCAKIDLNDFKTTLDKFDKKLNLINNFYDGEN